VEGYVIEAELGRGGAAEVYRVRHSATGERYALKKLLVHRDQLVERFRREAASLTALRHPNLVRAHGFVEIDEAPCLLLELVEGHSLAGWATRGAPTLVQSLSCFYGALRGVGHAHAQGFLHRDIKPANILLAPGAKGPVAKVTDFGLVKILSPTGFYDHLTLTGAAMGTLGYTAPEQFTDAKRADRRADVYSLGVLLHGMVTGSPAFAGASFASVLYQQRVGEFLALPATVPVAVADAVYACLSPNPADRPSDCRELARRIFGPRLAEGIDAPLPL
jgi:serine/threonine protein kinase